MPTASFACAAARGLDLAMVTVAITGKVDVCNLAASLGVKVGDPFKLSFLTLPSPVDRIANDGSGVHLSDGIAPYLVCNETFAVSVGGLKGTMGPAAAPVPPVLVPSTDVYFSLSAKRPVHDGIFLSTAASTPMPLPILMDTHKLYTGDFALDLNFGYVRGTLPSLHMKQASGSMYTSKGMLSSQLSISVSFPTNVVLSVKLDAIEMSYPKESRS